MADQPTDYLGSVMAAGSTLIHSNPPLERRDSVMQADRPPCRFAVCRKELAEPRTLEMPKPADEGGP